MATTGAIRNEGEMGGDKWQVGKQRCFYLFIYKPWQSDANPWSTQGFILAVTATRWL